MNTHNWIIGGAVVLGVGAAAWMLTRPEKKGPSKVDLSAFDSPDLPGSGKCMDRRFIKMLQQLQKETGYPVFKHINSGARSTAHNRKVGGVSGSSHLIPTCKAADIHAPSLFLRQKLANAAKRIGFRRIGIGKTFIHLDTDSSKAQNVAWGYPKGSPPPFNPFRT